MSFGFSVGDFIAVGELAERLYRNVYQVARQAPQQLKGLESELSQLSSALGILAKEIDNPESLLRRSGPDRFDMICQATADTKETLNKLEKFAQKHGLAKDGPESGRSKVRRGWDKYKFSRDAPAIDPLRGKLVYHYSVIQLVLTSTANSSLERFGREQTELIETTKEIRLYLTQQQDDAHANEPLTISAIDESSVNQWLARKFLDSADSSGNWASIGIDTWIEAAKWWMLKYYAGAARSEASDTSLSGQTGVDLVKACWILMDVIVNHPQRSYVTDVRQARAIRTLSQSLKDSIPGAVDRKLIQTLATSDLASLDLNVLLTRLPKLPELRANQNGQYQPHASDNSDGTLALYTYVRFITQQRSAPGSESILFVYACEDEKTCAKIECRSTTGDVLLSSDLRIADGFVTAGFITCIGARTRYNHLIAEWGLLWGSRGDCMLEFQSKRQLQTFSRALSDLLATRLFQTPCKNNPELLSRVKLYLWTRLWHCEFTDGSITEMADEGNLTFLRRFSSCYSAADLVDFLDYQCKRPPDLETPAPRESDPRESEQWESDGLDRAMFEDETFLDNFFSRAAGRILDAFPFLFAALLVIPSASDHQSLFQTIQSIDCFQDISIGRYVEKYIQLYLRHQPGGRENDSSMDGICDRLRRLAW